MIRLLREPFLLPLYRNPKIRQKDVDIPKISAKVTTSIADGTPTTNDGNPKARLLNLIFYIFTQKTLSSSNG
jgi:hypothetical protein